MTRTATIARIQFLNWRTVHGVPWATLAGSYLVSLLAFMATSESKKSQQAPGTLIAIFLTMLTIHALTITQTFPFCASLSITRGAFYRTMALLVTAQAVVYGAMLTLFKAIEQATGGWGVRMKYFEVPGISQRNPVLQTSTFAAGLLLMSFLGIVGGAVYKRWGQLGLIGGILGTAITIALALVVAEWLRWMTAIGSWFTTQPHFALFAVYPTLLTLVLAAIAYRLMMRARL